MGSSYLPISRSATALFGTLRKLLFLLLVAAVLQACAARRGLQLPALTDWEVRRTVLETVDRWEFRGRIGVSAGDEGFSGKLHWQQDGDDFRATVSGPLGIGTISIESDGKRITLTDKRGEVTELRDAELDLQLRYGWTIPLESLRFWALGIPDPSVEATLQFNDGGMLDRIEQRNWVVAITQYSDGGGQPMPRRITAVNEDAKVRLVLDRWIFY